jgi:hypothetical protein
MVVKSPSPWKYSWSYAISLGSHFVGFRWSEVRMKSFNNFNLRKLKFVEVYTSTGIAIEWENVGI